MCIHEIMLRDLSCFMIGQIVYDFGVMLFEPRCFCLFNRGVKLLEPSWLQGRRVRDYGVMLLGWSCFYNWTNCV